MNEISNLIIDVSRQLNGVAILHEWEGAIYTADRKIHIITEVKDALSTTAVLTGKTDDYETLWETARQEVGAFLDKFTIAKNIESYEYKIAASSFNGNFRRKNLILLFQKTRQISINTFL